MEDRPSIKSDDQYEALRDKGYSMDEAARIANTKNAGQKCGKALNYEDRTIIIWTKVD